jgi:hypothetical protein
LKLIRDPSKFIENLHRRASPQHRQPKKSIPRDRISHKQPVDPRRISQSIQTASNFFIFSKPHTKQASRKSPTHDKFWNFSLSVFANLPSPEMFVVEFVIQTTIFTSFFAAFRRVGAELLSKFRVSFALSTFLWFEFSQFFVSQELFACFSRVLDIFSPQKNRQISANRKNNKRLNEASKRTS